MAPGGLLGFPSGHPHVTRIEPSVIPPPVRAADPSGHVEVRTWTRGHGHHHGMDRYEAVVATADDGTLEDAGPLVVEFRNARTRRRAQFSLEEFTGGHLLHLAVAGCVYNDLIREAQARGITLTQIKVSADGGFAGSPCASTGIEYQIHVEGDASQAELKRLVAYVEEIAEVPSAIRIGGQVRLVASEVVSTES